MRLTSPHVVGEMERLPVGDRRLDFYIFHVFDEGTFRALLGLACARMGAVVEELARNPGPQFDEYVAVLPRR